MQLRAGAARRRITPPVGTPLSGYFTPRPSTGVLDDLWVNAVVVGSDNYTVAIAATDLLYISEESVARIRQSVNEATGIPEAGVLVCASHTHTGPYTLRVPDIQPPKVLETIEDEIIRAIIDAAAATVPVTLWCLSLDLGGISFIRRYRMRDGSVRTNPGVGNPDIAEPIGKPDNTLTVAVLRDEAMAPVATLYNFALHADTTGGDRISADWPGHAADVVRRLLQLPDLPVLFLNGATGDVNHIDVSGPERQTGPDCSQQIGSYIGEVVAAMAHSGVVYAGSETRLRGAALRLSRRQIPAEQLDAAREVVRLVEADPSLVRPIYTTEDITGSLSARYAYARQILALHEESENSRYIPVELQRIEIGELAINAVPAEIFGSTGRAIRSYDTCQYPMVAAYANGMLGYVPPGSAFDEGGYEVMLGQGSKMDEGAEARIRDAFADFRPRDQIDI